MDRRVPLDMESSKEEAIRRVGEIEEYDIGISGISFQTGPLSAQLFEAMMSRQNKDLMSDEIMRAYKVYAMDFTAKEATRTALKQNGFDSHFENEDMDVWGIVDSIQLLDPTGQNVGPLFDNWNHAVDQWKPGQGFNFVAREVGAKLKEVALQEVLDALDPDGSLRETALGAGLSIPTEDLRSLTDLANDVKRRCEEAPRGSSTTEKVYKGDHRRGYSAISRSELLVTSANRDGSENQKTLMHVMDALVAHGCLIVDLADNGANTDLPLIMAKMWEASTMFFATLDASPEREMQLPKMASIPASPYAKMGYINTQDGMKFMETRVDRATGDVMPAAISSIVGENGMDSLTRAFRVVTSVGKDVVRIATAASSVENKGFDALVEETPAISGSKFSDDASVGRDTSVSTIKASESAKLMVDELLDDGTFLYSSEQEGAVSMSPLRLCSYSNVKEDAPTEVFGAHTDSSFVTMVPVASVSGLEVYDEDAEQWYRPELKARSIWEAERESKGEDKLAFYETIQVGNDVLQIPWHARYIIVMPGEFLQIVSRNEIAAAVHRVVASGPARVSAPVLVRGRPGITMNIPRYLGRINDALLAQVNGLNIQQIHDAMQPISFQ